MDEIITRLDKAIEPTFTYLYWPKIDAVSHELGTGHSETTFAIRELDRELQRLSFNVPRATRIVVTADHGLLDVNESQTLWIEPGDAIASCLSREPSGDSRVVYFSLKDGQEARFRVEFAPALRRPIRPPNHRGSVRTWVVRAWDAVIPNERAPGRPRRRLARRRRHAISVPAPKCSTTPEDTCIEPLRTHSRRDADSTDPDLAVWFAPLRSVD